MDFMDYITGKALHLVPVLYIIGVFLKKTPNVPDWLIPWILTALGVIGGCAVISVSAEGVLQGVLAAGVTVLGNQLIKQSTEKS